MSSTINTQDCRKVVRVAWDAPESLFEIPDGLDLEDESVVEEWWVKWNTLHIKYVGKKEVEEIEPCQVRTIWDTSIRVLWGVLL